MQVLISIDWSLGYFTHVLLRMIRTFNVSFLYRDKAFTNLDLYDREKFIDEGQYQVK